MPRKASTPADSDAAPRRSGRLAALPQVAQETVQKVAPKKKRSANEGGEGESSVKKTKTDDTADVAMADDTAGEPAPDAEPQTTAAEAPAEETTTIADGTAVAAKDDAELNPAATKLDPIDIGGTLPSFTLKNEKDEDVNLVTLTAEKGLVLFLVPKADTPGCTTQACGFRDIYPDFTALNYEVYCLSADAPSAQTKWQVKKELPYPLLSDKKRVLIAALGAAEGGKTKRSHFIFEKGGKLVEKKIPVKPADSPKLALEFIKAHQA